MNTLSQHKAANTTPVSDGTVFDYATHTKLNVLVIEDEPLFSEIIEHRLASSTLVQTQTQCFITLQDGLDFLQDNPDVADILLLDLNVRDSKGLDTLIAVLQTAPTLPVVVLTGMDDDSLALSALESGAQDYLVKGRDDGTLDRAVLYAAERAQTQQKLRESQESLRKAKLQLIQADKMETLGRLAAGVAHEVKNPLAIVKMGLEFFSDMRSDNPEAAGIIRDMEDAVERAQNILAGMLDFSVPKELTRTTVQIDEVIVSAIRMVQHELDKCDIDIHHEPNPKLPPLNLDAPKIQQVFINLILNAAHALETGGNIDIRSSIKTLEIPGNGVGRRSTDTYSLGERLVTIDVLDTGPGLPEEQVNKLFDPFFTSKPVGEGTGLGLAITRNILELHGGKIELSNRENAGGACAKIVFVV